ncbi:hypothetical protein IP88_15350 [alpha proteobacterium AAP81b]|nr:hypothetical protein IP88_15350 [alpha proteobacterium AAP81b]
MLIAAIALYCYELIRAGSSSSRSAIGTEPARTDISAADLRYDLFVSAPMDAFDDDKSFQSNQAVVAKFLLALQTRVGAKQIYFGGAMTDQKAQFDDAGLGYETVRSALESAKSFILIWPQRVPSSCLVEVGIAAARHLPTAIFYRKDVSLPYLLRGKLASRMADKWPVTAYEYADFDALRQIIQLKGAELFPVPIP